MALIFAFPVWLGLAIRVGVGSAAICGGWWPSKGAHGSDHQIKSFTTLESYSRKIHGGAR